ncbi:MAG TPA: BTAD domain-containing putative transcriptional regulator [Gaiellales bacterium]|nr:BTAD domain-containing putative transcriptional regulator [Gaiellales bacterium]
MKTAGRRVPEADGREVRLQLLNWFELRAGGDTVHLPMSSQRLLAFLALRATPVLRVHLAGSLWLDSPEERSFANLRSALWRLHRSGLPLVESRKDLVRLDPRVRVDAREASDLARQLLGSFPGRIGVDVDWIPLAGDLLPDWDDDWVLVEREHFRHLGLRALEELAERLLAAGRLAAALEAALAAFAREPLRESVHRILVKVYLADGNSFEAIRQYHVYRDLARSRLGINPSIHMEQLVRGLIRDDAQISPGAAA